ncbi:hypothetical protein N7519_003619 [Penicillium mononematosum]|uniref:uncharacterized protein n=1 Tax=Penicillium mononematosum TaxID=268346 RepID=UPI0025467C10|nr:uncharacterized protein N7519_003619 [Penicillium mononematosum]KAJ6188711.1 hypothetical protein N7519_003619 [Penicillium mononematosum]
MSFSSNSAPPKEPVRPDYLWPLVLLTDLDETSQEKLAGFVESTLKEDLKHHSEQYFGDEFQGEACSKVKIWSPPRQLLASIAQPGPHRDSASNIHALAVLAYRSGRPRIIVADEATKRQLSGNHNFAWDTKHVISVILISVQRLHDDPDNFSVHARRANCLPPPLSPYDRNETNNSDYEGSVMEDVQPFPFYSVDKDAGPLWNYGWNWKGFVMHDPDREPFTADSAILGRELYAKAVTAALCPTLPSMELVTGIADRLSSPVKMPIWDRRPGRTHLVIFVLYHTTTEELHNTQKTIQDALSSIMEKVATDWEKDNEFQCSKPWKTDIPEMTAELIPWDRHGLRTRRELVAFWKEYHMWYTTFGWNNEDGALVYLSEPISDIDSAQLGVSRLFGLGDKPAMSFRRPLSTICAETARLGRLSLPSPSSSEIEILYHPDKPWFSVQTPWETVISDARSLVFLTNRLTEEQTQRLKELRLTPDETDAEFVGDGAGPGEWVQEYYALPWKNGEAGVPDGELKDIWEIIVEAYHDLTGGFIPIVLIFVDAQFAHDETVILARADICNYDPEHELLKHLPFARLRGFQFMRLPIQQTGSFEKNRAIDGEWLSYQRPGWPSSGALGAEPPSFCSSFYH